MESPGNLDSLRGAGLDAPYLSYLLLGMGTLLPWNALITAAGEPLCSSFPFACTLAMPAPPAYHMLCIRIVVDITYAFPIPAPADYWEAR